MTPLHFREFHLALLLVLGVVAIFNWRIYFKYLKIFGPEVSAGQQIKLLIRQKNPDGWIAVIASVIGVLTGIALMALYLYR